MNSISDKQLKEVTDKVKKCDKSWAESIANNISQTKEWKDYTNNPCNPDQVYHISRGTIKNQTHRLLFVESAALVIQAHAEKMSRAEKAISGIE